MCPRHTVSWQEVLARGKAHEGIGQPLLCVYVKLDGIGTIVMMIMVLYKMSAAIQMYTCSQHPILG